MAWAIAAGAECVEPAFFFSLFGPSGGAAALSFGDAARSPPPGFWDAARVPGGMGSCPSGSASSDAAEKPSESEAIAGSLPAPLPMRSLQVA